jgi:hypothetical protein
MTDSPRRITPLRWAAYCRHSSTATSQAGIDKCRRAPAHVPQIEAEPKLALFDAGRAMTSNLRKLVEMAQAGEIELLVVPGVSRVARSTLALSRFLTCRRNSSAWTKAAKAAKNPAPDSIA